MTSTYEEELVGSPTAEKAGRAEFKELRIRSYEFCRL